MRAGLRSATAVVLVCAACSAESGRGASSTAARSPVTTAGTSSAPAGRYVVRTWNVGSKPCAVVGGFGSIWVALYGEDEVARLDPATGRVRAEIATDISPCGMAMGAGSAWVENYQGDSVDRINPRTNRVQKEIPVGSAPFDITFAAGAAWVTNNGGATVTRIDAATYRKRTVQVGYSPIGIARAGGAVWVPNKEDGTVSRIDTATLRATTLHVGGSPGWTAYDGTSVWIGNDAHDVVQRIDAVSGRVVAQIRLATTTLINDGDALRGRVYFPSLDGSVYVIDERTDQVVGAFPTGLGNPFTLAAYAGRLWVIDYRGTTLEELDPARMRFQRS